MAIRAICWLMLTLTLSTYLIPAHSLSAEMQALVAFRKSLTDPDHVLSNWDVTHPTPCHWYYITCNSQYQVTAIIILNKNLSGRLAPELGMLSSLERLALPQSRLSGAIPPQLGSLKRLVYLRLSENQLSGSIPSSLGNLKSLHTLLLDNNKLSGKVPAEISKIPALQNADFSTNGNLCWAFWPTPEFKGSYPLCQK